MSEEGVMSKEGATGEARPRRRWLTWLRRGALGLGVVLLLLLLVAGGAALWFRGQLLASLPDVDGRLGLAGLAAPVTVERDALGIPTVRGESRADVARATGFLHGQDRFFQMDMMLRRAAAGELAALVGERGLRPDLAVRHHQFRRRARRAVERMPADQRAVLEAYADGVNAGLAALEAPPWEYVLLRAEPEPWLPEDSVLAVFAMYLELHEYTIGLEDNLDFMRRELPPEVYELLTPLGTEWEAPLTGGVYAGSSVEELVAGREIEGEGDDDDWRDPAPAGALPLGAATVVPGGAEGDGRTSDSGEVVNDGIPSDGSEDVAGSNAWAVAPKLTEYDAPILANDMHLPLSVPTLWYRVSLEWSGEDGEEHRVTGITLPGMPAVLAGSNGRVAWGLTASLLDVADLVLLEVEGGGEGEDGGDEPPTRYRTPDGWRDFDVVEDVVRVGAGDGAQGAPVTVRETIWGPVLEDERLGRHWALHWVAYEDGAVDLGALELETADTVDEALLAARAAGAPAQNIVAADADGNIGWSIFGRVPNRQGFSGRLPVSWAEGDHLWRGLLPPRQVPAVVNPESGLVWNANNRSVGGEAYALLGDGGYRSGARAMQIRDALLALAQEGADEGAEEGTREGTIDEEDMLAIQRDDRALFLERWHRFLLDEVLTPEAVEGHPERAEFRDAIETWDGRASVDSVSFRLVRGYRLLLAQHLFDGLTTELREIDQTFGLLRYPHYEEPLWELVTEQPPELVPEPYDTWDEALLGGLDVTIQALRGAQPGVPFSAMAWGQTNTLNVAHPFSGALPWVGRWLDMPRRALPGAEDMPLAQRPDYGASVRMVVAPGREEAGYAHVPMGQSGHPLSPHYADAFETWAGTGRPTPFLPGPPESTLVLVPEPPTSQSPHRQESDPS